MIEHLLDQVQDLEGRLLEVNKAFSEVDPDDEESLRKACVETKNLTNQIKNLTLELGAIKDEHEGQLASLMPFTRKDFADWGRVEIRSDTRRVWDHDRLLSVVLSRARDHAVDAETGEMRDPLVVAEDLLKKVAAFSYWRIGNLKNDLGIDGATYADTTYGRKRVIFK